MTFFWQYYIVILLLLGAPIDAQINPQIGLPAWYDPGESAAARLALEEMQLAAETDGVRLSVFSGYRSYFNQREVFFREASRDGTVADNYSARPGHSEHQLGTAYDVVWTGMDLNPSDERNRLLYDWLEEHAHLYGFVISYPLKSRPTWPYSNRFIPYITDFIYEPWHIRYVGSALASTIFTAGYLQADNEIVPQDFFQPWRFSVTEDQPVAP